jgi:hypothetical protein
MNPKFRDLMVFDRMQKKEKKKKIERARVGDWFIGWCQLTSRPVIKRKPVSIIPWVPLGRS